MKKSLMTALITGATGGIGRALCEEFKRAGYRVIATDKIQVEGVNCDQFIEVDLIKLIRDGTCLDAFIKKLQLTDDEGLSVLVNNAAIQILNTTEAVSIHDWDNTLDVNLLAPFFLTQSLLPYLEKAKGSVINIGSVHAQATKPGFACYATSKAALAGLTRALAVDLGGRVRVNAINPAAVATPMLLEGFKGKDALYAQLSDMHPVGRIANPDEIASVASFLASNKAVFITGTSIDVDGGILSRLHDPD